MFFSSILLGTGSAISNYSQVLNLLIGMDSKIFSEYSSFSKELTKDIADRAGVLDFINSFNQYLAQGTAEAFDFVIGAKELLKLQTILKDKKFKTTKQLLNWMLSKEQYRKMFTNMAKNSAFPEDVEAYGKLWIEMMFSKKPTNKAEFRQYMIKMRRLRLLNKNLTMEQVNKMAMWKLQWHLSPFQHLTFSGAELNMRKRTAVMGVIAARDAGRLDKYKKYLADGSWEWDVDLTDGVGHPYFTPEAIHFARLAVDNSMFGMSPPHLPFLLTGGGRFWGQYKQYTWAQVLFEKKIIQNFINAIKEEDGEGNIKYVQSSIEGSKLLSNIIIQYLQRGYKGARGKGWDFDPTKDSRETRQLLKFIGLRMVLPMVVGPLMFSTGAAISLLTQSASTRMWTGARSATFMTASILWNYMLMGEGEDEEEMNQAKRMFLMLLLPPIVTTGIALLDNFTEE